MPHLRWENPVDRNHVIQTVFNDILDTDDQREAHIDEFNAQTDGQRTIRVHLCRGWNVGLFTSTQYFLKVDTLIKSAT